MRRRYILDIACRGKTDFKDKYKLIFDQHISDQLKKLSEDGLIILDHNGLQVTKIGSLFLRNICHAFDLKETMPKDDKIRSSKSI